MTRVRRRLAGLACAILLAAPGYASAQVAGAPYEVRRGDTLFAIARKARPEGASLNQTIAAIARANAQAFPAGNVNLLEVGAVLNIPMKDAIAGIAAADADRTVRDMLALRPAVAAPQTPAAPPVAAAKPSVAPQKPPPVPAGKEDAARRFQEAQAMERSGNHKGALEAYLVSAEAGYGPAQRRLGEIYDKGSPAAARDYQQSLRWYEKARSQGVDIPKPIQRVPH